MSSTNPVIESLRITAPEACHERLEFALEQLAESASSWQPADSDHIIIEAYFECAEDADRAKAAITAQLMALTGGLEGWRIDRDSLPVKDWSTAWKAFFHVEKVSQRIVIKPSWEPYTAAPSECVIEIDPGMSFGTGQHETTRSCLRFLDQLSTRQNQLCSFLDLGCGSGILSIAAAKLGCRPIRAIDIDSDSVAIARENLAINSCSECVTVDAGDVGALTVSAPYAIVVANILAPVLVQHASAIAACVADHGQLLLAGILSTQYDDVLNVYAAQGFLEHDRIIDGEWTSGWLKKASNGESFSHDDSAHG